MTQNQAVFDQHLAGKKEQDRFRHLLLEWFKDHARDLPWRRTSDPYAIWVSEIMLQQTRVNAVLDHYARFMARFPTIEALAKAEEPDVLALWSGLGYYRRARMLHKAARVVVNELCGRIPQTAAGLRLLPGIGDYTSAAIASIAFGEAAAVVDGNVERVILRLKALEAITKTAKIVRETAQALLDPAHPSDFNQAMMELGATICTPKSPLCLHCPVQSLCLTRGEHPVAPRREMTSRSVAYALLRRNRRGGEVLLEQRPHDASLMAGMWELPFVPEADENRLLLTVRHSITVTNYTVSVLHFEAGELTLLPASDKRKWFRTADLPTLPLTGLARKILKRLHLFPEKLSARS